MAEESQEEEERDIMEICRLSERFYTQLEYVQNVVESVDIMDTYMANNLYVEETNISDNHERKRKYEHNHCNLTNQRW